MHEALRIQLMEQSSFEDYNVVRLALAVSMPSGRPSVVRARELLQGLVLDRRMPCDSLDVLHAPIIHHAHGSFSIFHDHGSFGYTFVGCIGTVSDIGIYSCPFPPDQYDMDRSMDYLHRRADLHIYIANLGGRHLTCDCKLGRNSCWAWALHDLFVSIIPGAVVTDPVTDEEIPDSVDVAPDPRARDVVAGGRQVKRGKFPQLVPDGLSPQDHLRMALSLEHPFKTVAPSTPAVRHALSVSKMSSSELVDLRVKVSSAVSALADATRDEDLRIREAAHPSVRRVLEAYLPKNLAFMREMGLACGCDDDEAVLRLFLGLPMLGWAPDARGLMKRVRHPSCSVPEWLADREQRNDKLLRGIRGSGDHDLDCKAYLKTLEEVRQGTMQGPFYSIESVPINHPCVAPRVGIWENHGASEAPSIRNIDNLLLGEQNSTVGTCAAHRPTDADALVGQARAVADTFPGERLVGWCSDFAKAFKQVPCDPQQLRFVVIAQWDPVTACVALFICHCQVFGSKSAPLNFSRFPAWCMQVLAVAWAIAASHCVDDVISIERESTAFSAREAWLLLASCCGWLISMEKSPAPSARFLVIGVLLDLGNFTLSVSQKRIQSLEVLIRDILLSKKLPSGQAASLSGKLGFTLCATFGRIGRARMRPIYLRAYSTMTKVDFCLYVCLSWWLVFLKSYRPRDIPMGLAHWPVIISYSDGEGRDAGVGAAAWCSWREHPIAAFFYVPTEIRAMWASMAGNPVYRDIYAVEAVGPLLLLIAFPKVFRNALWLHFIDNTSAESSLISGSSRLDLADHIVGLTWHLCAQRGLAPFFDRVESKANPVDKLSRGQAEGPWREVVMAKFPVGELQALADESGGWLSTSSSS